MMRVATDLVQGAFEALARGAFTYVTDCLDRVELDRVSAVRLEVYRASSPADQEAQLTLWGLAAAEELVRLTPQQVALQGLKALPQVRATVSTRNLSASPIDAGLARAHYYLSWAGVDDALPRSALLRQRDGKWRIVPSLLSPWLLPGFEDTIVSASSR